MRTQLMVASATVSRSQPRHSRRQRKSRGRLQPGFGSPRRRKMPISSSSCAHSLPTSRRLSSRGHSTRPHRLPRDGSGSRTESLTRISACLTGPTTPMTIFSCSTPERYTGSMSNLAHLYRPARRGPACPQRQGQGLRLSRQVEHETQQVCRLDRLRIVHAHGSD